ncbi:uncharacterized protein LOC34618253 [Cyclospora cayetanensis]|uniref:Uncharacterized protein LOC34618253 n=1 Tax=Cyclospora cayetanensis TaxID=88456 RepID=A0A6P6S2Q2_9EIME|nr:uncharacterized protein LOC34618253 [Cyclospora cayetanensis]
MDLCHFCCTEEADLGVAPYDRIAAHVGLSDDDLLDFESDDAGAPSLAKGVCLSVSGRSPPPAFKSRVSSEVYRLEENMRRCRDGSKVFRSRQGSSLSRSGGSPCVTRLSDMSPEEKEEEKRRLQALVKEFAREAVAGFGLTIVDADRDLSAAATFSMDRHLLDISIDSFEEAQVPSAHFAVGSLTGAFKAEDFYNGEKNPQAPLSVDLESALG